MDSLLRKIRLVHGARNCKIAQTLEERKFVAHFLHDSQPLRKFATVSIPVAAKVKQIKRIDPFPPTNNLSFVESRFFNMFPIPIPQLLSSILTS
jgi:hypothetical protein